VFSPTRSRTSIAEEKVGQVIQADIYSVTPDEVRKYKLGSVLNGGNSAPGADNRAAAEAWLALADEFWDASTDTGDGGVGIPVIWGTDAVHGHSNVVGATLFPHNIGLGIPNEPDLMYEVGRVTALEMLSTGLDWTFAPTIAVVRNDRWGRTYESYSEDPKIVVDYAPRIIEGIQGKLGTEDFLGASRMIATAKHFAGDGGTTDGIDQGNTEISEAEFRDVQAAAYPAAIRAGVQTVMASYNSFHGRKMHGYREMLTDVLVGRMGFDGFVVGDWNGHGQVSGCTNTSCAASINAGLDLFMAPDSWKGLYESTLQDARAGVISMARLDEAVSRILRVKMRAGVFEAGRPSSREHAGDFSLLSAPEHRAVARRAVRGSLVLLKNENGLLPLSPDLRVLVAGDGADNIGKQSGGWTLSWQGTGNLNEHFPNATSVYAGIREAFLEQAGSAILSVDGSYTQKPDVAVVVFGEEPYAEGVGDRDSVDYIPDDGLRLLQEFRAAGIATVSVFLSGRPMWVNPELNASDAFVAAWLPGSEGAGIADVLIANADGSPRFDFTGRLSFSWPRAADQVSVNVGDANYDPLFPYGYGLGYNDDVSTGTLPEDGGFVPAVDDIALIELGDPAGEWALLLRDEQGEDILNESRGASRNGALQAQPADYELQEDSVVLTWSGPASLVVSGDIVDLGDAASGERSLEIRYRVLSSAAQHAVLAVGEGTFDVTAAFAEQAGMEWQTVSIDLACFDKFEAQATSVNEPLAISADGELVLQLISARIVPGSAGDDCEF
jgi:beta-glucosidase